MLKIIYISTNEKSISIFKDISFKKKERLGVLLSKRIEAKNFRLRESLVGYSTNWHLSGDPTLISNLKGRLRTILQKKSKSILKLVIHLFLTIICQSILFLVRKSMSIKQKL